LALTPVTAEQIAADLLTDILSSSPTTVTDANPGSVLSTIMEAVSVELEKVQNDILVETDQGIESAPYSILQTTNLPAQAAYGPVTLSVPTAPPSSIPIPEGTTVATSNSAITYTLDSAVAIAAGTTSVSGTVTCTTPGTQGNVVAGAISVILSPTSVIAAGVQVTNPYAFTTGANAETNAEKSARAQQAFASLHRGDQYALEYGALQAYVAGANGQVVEQVVKSQAVTGASAGSATVYIYNGTPYGSSTGTASSALVSACQNELDGYVDATGKTHLGWIVVGQVATATAATASVVNVSATLVLAPGYALSAIQGAVTQALQNYFSTLDIGSAVSLTAMGRSIIQVPGVVDAAITVPSTAPAATNGTIYLLGTVTLTA
jgi:uncharacterized phage protein gp47/JayE